MPSAAVVALLGAAYAAAAGLAATFLVGYPTTWGSALLIIGLLCLAVVLTAHVAAGRAPTPAEVEDPTTLAAGVVVSRRGALGLVGTAVAVGAGGSGTALSLLSGTTSGPGGAAAVSVADLRGATTPAPGGARVRHVLTARTATLELPSGDAVDALTYDGRAPGPAIAATEGDLVEVTLRNADVADGVTLHWHGYDVACGEDGVPGLTQHPVAPGEHFDYHFRAEQVGTYWYHTHQVSHVGVRQGLYGTFVVHPRSAGRTTQLDVVLPLHTFGDTVLVGGPGTSTDRTVAAGTPVRLRMVNTDPDPHRLALTGTPFRVVAVDGRDLHRPGEVDRVGLRLPAGGRYDVAFAMPAAPVRLVVDDADDVSVRLAPAADSAPEATAEDTSGWPELDLLHYGEPTGVPPIDQGNADRRLTMVLDRGLAMVDGRPAYAHTVGGRAHPSIPDLSVTEGDLVVLVVVNRSLETHPWHLHGHPVLVLSRDGEAASGSPLWVDTFDVRPGQVWEVAFRADNPGIWMNHCHNLPHADQGMMLRLAYDGVTSPFADGHAGHG